MKHWLMLGLFCTLGLRLAVAQEEKFSTVVTPADFAAAGLKKLSPEELAQLDRLVQAYKSGAIEVARKEAAAAAVARADAEAKAKQAEAKASQAESEMQAAKAQAAKAEAAQAKAAKSEAAKPKEGFVGGLLNKAKVILTPGTEIEYETVETRLLGTFKGWGVGTTFTLENGQRWQVTGGEYVTPPEEGPKKVRIIPGTLGSFFLEIEGVRQKPKVKFVGGAK